MKLFLGLLLIISFSACADLLESVAQTKTPEDDKAKIALYRQACQAIDSLLVRKQFKVECNSNYSLFGSTSKSAAKTFGNLRIAGYNLLHPGTSKALFKDYKLVAKIMNQYDVVSGMELLGTVGHDGVNNQAVLSFLSESPKMMSELQALKEKTTDAKKLKEIDVKLEKLTADSQKAYSLYRAPGYFKILLALKKLDPSWSLILSPRGDSALQGSVEEMVGFYFRASNVAPVINPHCSEFKDKDGGTPYACLINLSEKFMDKNYIHNFARRPFMASFKSGNMKFTLVSSHVVFTFSGDEEASKKLMQEVFGVDAPSELGGGINMSNFARFAEVKTTLNFMNRYREKYNDNKIMFISDTNLQATNAFWPEVLKNFSGGSLLIDEETTISPPRYTSDGKETNGVANSYDHFILDKSVFPGCNNGEVYNYYKSDIGKDVERIYGIRQEESPLGLRLKSIVIPWDEVGIGGDVPPEDNPLPTKLDYPLTEAAKEKIEKMMGIYSLQLNNMFTIKRNEVVPDDFQIVERIDSYKRRIFINQLTNAFYNRFFQEILSDHFPVSITCKN